MLQASQTRTSLIVIQATPFCNINCTYCYLPFRDDRTKLTIEDIGRIFERLLTFPTIAEEVTVVWHAGEPLVLGPAYYDAVFQRCRDLCAPRLKVDHAFQTNGLLINDEWCDLFERWQVGIGVSVDGPKEIHDATRKTRKGKGTFEKVIAGIECLQGRQIPFYVISVLTKAALLQPDAMFRFYEEHDIREVGFNIDEKEGDYKESSFDESFDDYLVVGFFQRMTTLMEERRFAITIRELERTLSAIRFLDHPNVSNEQTAFGIITIDVMGNVYTFSPELAGYSSKQFSTFAIGNIFEHGFERLERSGVLMKMAAEIRSGISACEAECKYFRICQGGSPSNKLFENGTFASTETICCRLTKKRVADFVLSTIEQRLLS